MGHASRTMSGAILRAPRWSRAGALALALLSACGAARAALPAERIEVVAENRIAADAPEWRDVAAWFAGQPDAVARFEERRMFPFRKEAVVLRGEVRVSRQRGLSLHYTAPEERVVILDEQGVLVRDATGQQTPPDRRAEAGQRALLHVLRLDLAALGREFDVFGRRTGDAWALTLVPKDDVLRRGIGNIHVAGQRAEVRTIELRKSARQHIVIAMSEARAPVTFTAEETTRYFR